MRALSTIHLAGLVLALAGSACGPRPEPGEAGVLEFPALAPTLHARASDASSAPRLGISLPEPFDRRARYPLLVYVDGGDGGPGDRLALARSLAGGEPTICANLPLFKLQLAPLAADDSNRWSRLRLDREDAALLAERWEPMLEHLFHSLPQIDPTRTTIVGFSNGANAISLLLPREDGPMRRFKQVVLVEGGYPLRIDHDRLPRSLLWLYGELSHFRPPAASLVRLRNQGVVAAEREMPATGHALPEGQFAVIRDWLSAPRR